MAHRSPLISAHLLLALCLLGSHLAWARETIILGAEDDAAPWSYADGTGYVNDVVRQAFDAAGWQVQLKVMPYARCKALALQGQLAGCFSVSKTPDLLDRLSFPSHSVLEARNLLIARTDAPWSGCDPRQWPKPPRVGTVRQYEYRIGIDTLFQARQARPDESDSEVSNLRKLQLGRLDATLVTVDTVKRLEALQSQAQTNLSLKIVCDYGSEPAYVAFSPRHRQGPAAQAAYEAGYARLMDSGALTQIQLTWQARLLDATRAKVH